MLLEHFHHIFFICPISLFFVDITLLFFTYVHSFCFLWILHFCFFHMSILSVFCGYYVFVFYICPFTSFFRTVCFCFSQSTAHCLTMTSHCLAMKFQIFQTATNKPPDASRHPGACYVSDDTLLFFYNTLLIFK